MNRRQMISTSAMAGAGFVVGTGAAAPKCGGPSVSGVVTIITGAIAELRILFPAQEGILGKIVTLANRFNEAWIAGKLDDARTFFLNLDTLVGQVISDLGINASTRIKLLLASVGIAVRTIAALIKEQGDAQPQAVQAADAKTVDRVRQLADSATADALLKASRA